MDKLVYVLGHVAYFLASLGSRTVNAVFFGGSMHQTLSARAYAEGRRSPAWRRREAIIDRLLFWEPDHCKASWEDEVRRAMRTLEKNGAIGEVDFRKHGDLVSAILRSEQHFEASP